MTTEYINRLGHVFQRALDGDGEALDVAEILARRGFEHKFFDRVEEVRLAAQVIIIKADLEIGVGGSCRGRCGMNRVCAVNALIDRKVEDGQITARLGMASKYKVNYGQIMDCRLAEPHRQVEVASYDSPRFISD